MSDVLLGGQAGPSQGASEHTCRRVLAGSPEEVRPRLVRALERLDYRLLSEQPPVLAKRPARKDIISADLNDMARTLAVGLKPGGVAATVATFDYTVIHGQPWDLGKGDRHTLELEADAIVALVGLGEAGGPCALCGAENPSEARFCRGCGAPLLLGEPAELELMRLEAGARTAHQEHIFGLLIILAALAVTLPMILFGGPKLAGVGRVLFALGMLAGTWMLLYGVRRLHRTLNPKEGERRSPAAQAPAAVPPARAAALPPRPANFSVTDATTELLGGAESRRPSPAPARARAADTDPLP